MRPTIVLLIAFIVATTVEANLFEELFEEKWHELLSKQEWELFKLDHDKTYENEDEEQLRREIFLMNKKKIEEHNAKYAQGLVTFELGVNQFTDMLHEEVMSIMTGAIFNVTELELSSTGSIFISPANVQVPKAVDWRASGAVTAVKNQGRCGSCWAFSTTGALEGQIFRQKKQLISLSEQNLVDCSTNYDHGCQGGNPINAYGYISRNRGIDTESSYPYEAKQANCRFNPKSVGATDKGYKLIPPSNEKLLMEAVATVGPISVLLNAGLHSFSAYRGGVYYDPSCSEDVLNHAVLAVGYGTDEKGMDYWLLKNSWGSRWGENGYMRLARNKRNNCGVARSATYPLV